MCLTFIKKSQSLNSLSVISWDFSCCCCLRRREWNNSILCSLNSSHQACDLTLISQDRFKLFEWRDFLSYWQQEKVLVLERVGCGSSALSQGTQARLCVQAHALLAVWISPCWRKLLHWLGTQDVWESPVKYRLCSPAGRVFITALLAWGGVIWSFQMFISQQYWEFCGNR